MFDGMLKKYNSEVFVSDVAIGEVAFDRELNSARTICEKGYSIRTISDMRLGNASSNIFDKREIEKIVRESIDSGAHTKPLPKEFSFSSEEGHSNVERTYDKSTAKDLEGRAIEIATLALEGAEENNVLITDGRARAVCVKYRIINSLGLDKEETGTFITVLMDAKAKTDKPLAEVPLIFRERVYDKKNYSSWLEKKIGLVSRFVRPQKIPTGKYDIILSPDVFGPLLLDTVGYWASGKARLEETGLFKKAGANVAAPGISIDMDGTYPGGLSTTSIDAEGNKTMHRPVIRKGAFCDYFYDQKYASYFNEASTGSAMRASSSGAEKIYAGSPYCGPENLIVAAGDAKIQEVLDDAKGIFVENVGIASADSETGLFGFELRNAFIINKGNFTPARYAVFSGTVQNLLQKARLTREREAIGESGEAEFSSTCICPYAFIEKQGITGSTAK